MKKLLYVLLFIPFFTACGSDDDNIDKDENKDNYEYHFTLTVGDIPAKDASITLYDEKGVFAQTISGVNILANSSQSFTTGYSRISISFRQGSNLYYHFPDNTIYYTLKKSSNTITLNRQVSYAK